VVARTAGAAGFCAAILMLSGPVSAATCDLDDDGFVDIRDIRTLTARRNEPASTGDPADADGDGVITVLDARRCVLQCTLPRCAVPAPNEPPVITSAPPLDATVGVPYGYAAQATDPEGAPLTWSVDAGPAGLGVEALTGIVKWTPGDTQAGPNPVTLRVADPEGAFATQSFVIDVAPPPNEPPVITSAPPLDATVGVPYGYAAQATDPEGAPLTWSVDAGPAGLGVEAITGIVKWTPGDTQAGSNPVTLRVADPEGAFATQSFVIDVAPPPNEPPVITSAPPLDATVGSPFTYDAQATDPDGDTLTWRLPIAPAGMAVEPASGLVTWTPAAAQTGPNAVVLEVDDVRGGVATQSFTVTVDEPLVIVPDVIGLTQAQAEAGIAAADLLVGTVTTAYSDTVPAGSVIAQDPTAGSEVLDATLVDLVVSLGPAVVETALVEAVPTVVGLGEEAVISCRGLNADGTEVTPTPAFTLAATPPGVLGSGDRFSAPESGDYDVTCTFGSGAVGAVTVQVLPEDTDPSLSGITLAFDGLGTAADEVVAANEAEDLIALQATKDELVALAATVRATTVAEPLPADADLPSATQLADAGDVPDPVADPAFAAALANLRQNFADYAALLATFDPATATEALIAEMNALTSAAEALTDELDALAPSVAGILAVNDELNELVSATLPGQTADQADVLVEVLLTAPGIVQREDDPFWRLQLQGPTELYAGLEPDGTPAALWYGERRETFSLVSVMTSTAIAGRLRSQMIKRVYKPLWKKWKAAVKFLQDNGLDEPVGVDPPTFFLFNTSLSTSGGQIVGDGGNMVAGETTLRIQTNRGGYTIDLPVATGGGFETIIVAYPPFPFSCSLLSPCTALVSLITPGGQSATESVSIF
jgi:hypothetical protein